MTRPTLFMIACLGVFTWLPRNLPANQIQQARPGSSDTDTLRAKADEILTRLEVQFPITEHWFGQAKTIRIDKTDKGFVPNWSTVTHRRVLRTDASGQRLLPVLPLRSAGTTRITLDGANDLWVETTPLDIADVPGTARDGMVIYPGAYGRSDVLYKLTPTHIDEYIWVPDGNERQIFHHRLRFGPAVGKVETTPEQLTVFDKSNTPRLRIRRPFARDANGERRDGTLELRGDILIQHMPLDGLTFPVLIDPDWTTTGRLSEERFMYSLLTLNDGEVIAPGGCTHIACPSQLRMPNCLLVVKETERYSTTTGSWRAAAELDQERYAHALVALPSGALIAGGCTTAGCSVVTNTVEIYSTASDTWTTTGSLSSARAFPTASVLPDGNILMVGGCNTTSCLSTVEIWNTSGGGWTAGPALANARGRHTATVLADGRIMIAGGCTSLECDTVLDSVEIYDPAMNQWLDAGTLSGARAGHTATRLDNDDVLIIGGCSNSQCTPTLNAVDRWAAAGQTWSSTATMIERRHNHTAELLSDGTVLVAGGCIQDGTCKSETELYHPGDDTWTAAEQLEFDRGYQGATLLPDGQYLIAGGCNNSTCLPWVEYFNDPLTDAGITVDGGEPTTPNGGCCQSSQDVPLPQLALALVIGLVLSRRWFG